MSIRSSSTAALLLAACALTACSSDEDPTPHPQVTAPDSAVRLVGPDEADLVLYVSNQSFEDETVRMKVTVDGVTVVDGNFHVEGQHNWVRYPLRLSPGSHQVVAESDSGAALNESFQLPGDEARYAVVDYRAEDDSAELSWRFQRDPLTFA
jgi:hypothetical protein